MNDIHFKKIYIGKSTELDSVDLTPCVRDMWEEVLLDETATKSVMIFRKNRKGEISVETIMRDGDDIKSHIGDDTIDEMVMWNTITTANKNGCDVYLTIDRHKYDQWIYNNR